MLTGINRSKSIGSHTITERSNRPCNRMTAQYGAIDKYLAQPITGRATTCSVQWGG
jgi:hypothetical protein